MIRICGYKILMISTAAMLGFGAVFPVFVSYSYADDGEEYTVEQYYEDYGMTEEMAEDIQNRQDDAISQLEELKAQTRITRESMVDTTTGPQTYFDDAVMPDTTTPPPEGTDTKKVYKYDNDTGAVAPKRLFNNVR